MVYRLRNKIMVGFVVGFLIMAILAATTVQSSASGAGNCSGARDGVQHLVNASSFKSCQRVLDRYDSIARVVWTKAPFPASATLCLRVTKIKGTCPPSPPGLWRVHGLTRSAHAEIRNTKTWKSVNLAWAVRISGDGGQEGRHLAKKKGSPVG